MVTVHACNTQTTAKPDLTTGYVRTRTKMLKITGNAESQVSEINLEKNKNKIEQIKFNWTYMKISEEGGRKQRANCRGTSSAFHGHDDLPEKILFTTQNLNCN